MSGVILRAHGEVTVVVYDSKITAMNLPGGMVYRYTDNKTESVLRAAKAFAPKRTGRLVGGIRKDVRTTSRDRVIGRVRSTAPHSTWVHEGTYGPIEARGTAEHGMMRLPAWKGAPPGVTILRQRVAGQRANPFLTRALAVGLAGSYASPLGPANPFI